MADRLGGVDVPLGGKSPEIGRCQLCSPAYRATFGPRMLATARPDLRCADGEQR